MRRWTKQLRVLKSVLGALGGSLVGIGAIANPSPAAPSSPPALPPTARYARGEAVDLALIIAEWRQRFPQIPVFTCVCQGASCDHRERWPFRQFGQAQSTVTLGPFNAAYAESQGFGCYDIASGLRPEDAAAGGGNQATTQVEVLPGGRQLRLQANGTAQTVSIDNWNVNLLQALDCSGPALVDEQVLTPQRIIGQPAVDAQTGQVAVSVLLTDCFETQQSAVFVLDPQAGGYAIYRLQVPGPQALPNEFSTYPLSSPTGLIYWDGQLLVRHGDASGTESLLVFGPGSTPAGSYSGCIDLRQGESPTLCPDLFP